ncbi:MAG: IS4 family transposase [Flavisolibacter sp.]|nr:IS4 family transposase [Flavisolibacter sp.]
MTAPELIKQIPEHVFSDLAVETKVDHQVKKLSGEVMFKLILFSMLNSEKLSLRVMESFLSSAQFKSFARTESLQGKYNSIRDRICNIQADYFEKLFETIFTIYNKELKEGKALTKADSTYVSLATKLFAHGIKNGHDDTKRHAKYSVALKGSLPASVKVYTKQAYISEDLALSELINEATYLKEGIVVFDRGVQSREAFDQFTLDGKLFISRAKTNIQFKVVSAGRLPCKPAGASVSITSDQTGFLFKRKGKKTAQQYRLIKGVIDKSAEEIWWITNIAEEDAYTIAHWYKQRWEIEVFFKFIKQHLHATHLVSRTDNGMKVMIYMTMTLAILLIAYKEINKIKGFKIAKLKFEIELENDILKTIVMLCGGDPYKATHLFQDG